jgi:hypothetical protein
MERTVLERINDHHIIGYQVKRGSHGGVVNLAAREGVSLAVWKKVKGDTLVMSVVPTEHKDRPVDGRKRSGEKLDVVRAKMFAIFTVKETRPGVCRIVYVNQTDAGGRLPVSVKNHTLLRNLALTYKVKEFFQVMRGLDVWGEEDGEVTADMLLVKTAAEKNHKKGETKVEARVRAMMERHKGLRELGERWEWFGPFLVKLVQNKLRPAGVQAGVRLCNMNTKQAKVIGGSLASSIATNLTARAAVDEWILRYPALRELEHE